MNYELAKQSLLTAYFVCCPTGQHQGRMSALVQELEKASASYKHILARITHHLEAGITRGEWL